MDVVHAMAPPYQPHHVQLHRYHSGPPSPLTLKRGTPGDSMQIKNEGVLTKGFRDSLQSSQHLTSPLFTMQVRLHLEYSMQANRSADVNQHLIKSFLTVKDYSSRSRNLRRNLIVV